jgi:hypothetical protein
LLFGLIAPSYALAPAPLLKFKGLKAANNDEENTGIGHDRKALLQRSEIRPCTAGTRTYITTTQKEAAKVLPANTIQHTKLTYKSSAHSSIGSNCTQSGKKPM